MALLKDEIGPEVVETLAAALHRRDPAFDAAAFTEAVLVDLASLELKDRINLLADTMAERLPGDYRTALAVVVGAATDGVDGWAAWPLCSFVERHGVDDPEASLTAMATLTRRWSCEFAIRPFLDQHLEATQAHLRRWVVDDDEHVRRLASEGTRPFLPWGPKVAALIDDPQIGIEAITALRHDPSETVRRSVANHLNDLARFEPELVVDTLRSWVDEPEPVDGRMVRHALRTLVKNGHPGALHLLGFTTDPQVSVDVFSCSPAEVTIGGHIDLAATITSETDHDQLMVVDFVVHHVNASGATSPKVFKWTNLTLEAGATAELTKRRSIKPASTRTYHPGRHRVDLQVSGHTLATTHFDLDE